MTMDASQIEVIGASLAEAWKARRAMAAMPAPPPASREDAYRIQDAIARNIGQPVAGWKFGATSPAVRRLEGHSGPIVGRVFASMVFTSPALIPAKQIPDARIEAEFGFEYLRDLPPRRSGYSLEEVEACVIMRPALEIIGNRYPKPLERPLTTLEEIADNGTGWGLVVGEPLENWRDVDVANLVIALAVDGGAPSANFLGEDRCVPLHVALECANMASQRGVGIAAGQYITTGSSTLPLPIGKGSHVEADFGPLGRIVVDVC